VGGQRAPRQGCSGSQDRCGRCPVTGHAGASRAAVRVAHPAAADAPVAAGGASASEARGHVVQRLENSAAQDAGGRARPTQRGGGRHPWCRRAPWSRRTSPGAPCMRCWTARAGCGPAGTICSRPRAPSSSASCTASWPRRSCSTSSSASPGWTSTCWKAYEPHLRLLQTIPGIDLQGAAMLLVEIGTDMDNFGSAEHLASWVGICPGNNESAGKLESGRIRRGNAWVRRLLCKFAQAAARTRCALKAKFESLAIGKGYKKSIVALAHKMLRTIFAMLSTGTHYQDKTVDYDVPERGPQCPAIDQDAAQSRLHRHACFSLRSPYSPQHQRRLALGQAAPRPQRVFFHINAAHKQRYRQSFSSSRSRVPRSRLQNKPAAMGRFEPLVSESREAGSVGAVLRHQEAARRYSLWSHATGSRGHGCSPTVL
jgi:hypothetical protein